MTTTPKFAEISPKNRNNVYEAFARQYRDLSNSRDTINRQIVISRLRTLFHPRCAAITLSDLCAIVLSFLPLFLICHWTAACLSEPYVDHRLSVIGVWLALLMLWFSLLGHYSVLSSPDCEILQICSVGALGGIISFLSTVMVGTPTTFMLTWLVIPPAIILSRLLTRHLLCYLDWCRIRTVVLGDERAIADVSLAMNSDPALGYDIIATQDLMESLDSNAVSPGRAIAEDAGADLLIIALSGHNPMSDQRIRALLAADRVLSAIAMTTDTAPLRSNGKSYFIGHDIVLLRGRSRLNDPVRLGAKRCFDVVIACLILLTVLPMLAIIILLVMADGASPFFVHQRIGQNGKRFGCIKFRSMVNDADARLKCHLAYNSDAAVEWAHTLKLRYDPRITKVGHLLRRTSLDELPQLLNVLKGEMSLVGPRPIVAAEIDRYGDDIKSYYKVRPGITGLWQVSGRSNLAYRERVRLDAWYATNWALRHDVAILVKTISAVLSRNGAR